MEDTQKHCLASEEYEEGAGKISPPGTSVGKECKEKEK